MTLLIIAIGGLVAVVATGGTALAVRARRERDAVLELVPGVSSRVPTGWAGAHSPEARAFRRLGDAVRAGRSAPGLSLGAMSEQRHAMEDEALRLEARLLAAASVPGERRSAAIAEVVELVSQYESMVTDLVLAVGESPVALDGLAAEATVRLEALREARLEVERIDAEHRRPE